MQSKIVPFHRDADFIAGQYLSDHSSTSYRRAVICSISVSLIGFTYFKGRFWFKGYCSCLAEIHFPGILERKLIGRSCLPVCVLKPSSATGSAFLWATSEIDFIIIPKNLGAIEGI